MLPINSSAETLLASQPIYSANKDLFGFELLFRHEAQLSASEFGDDLATSEVLLNLCTGLSEQLDLHARPMFVNFSESFLFSETFLPIPPKNIVIELPPTILITPQVVEAVKKWRAVGFRFSLDGFDFDPRYEPLLSLVDYIKVDVLNVSYLNIASMIKRFAEYPIVWIAERVETEEQFHKFNDLGFSLFQGYFLAKPLPVQGYALRRKVYCSVGTIKAVNQPEIDIDELAGVVSRDPYLATQLLKIINSPACALRRTISSLKEAITYLGLAQVRKWAIMLSLMNNSVVNASTVRLVLTRAKACENYASSTVFTCPEKAFLVGLLSGIKLLFGVDNDLFMKRASLHAEIETAVLRHHGFLGQILDEIIRTEHSIMQVPVTIHAKDATMLFAYQQANNWAEHALSSTA